MHCLVASAYMHVSVCTILPGVLLTHVQFCMPCLSSPPAALTLTLHTLLNEWRPGCMLLYSMHVPWHSCARPSTLVLATFARLAFQLWCTS
ncbi:hypothetical protein COO60DRAFT_1162755 [Scenedesmus sp. NREL 46B-D3]|nr:hypothetical protein COO60DRAFT_1162755 [Scenedesmus sp. NREL 46B-D3]